VKHVLSCVSVSPLTEAFTQDLRELLKSLPLEIEDETYLQESGNRVLEFTFALPSGKKATDYKIELMKLSNLHAVDMALLEVSSRSKKKLIIFDMDSTLIQHEVIDEMASVFGIGEKVRSITERAMKGELNFDQALKERVSLLKGLKREELEKIYSHLRLTPGAEVLIRVLKGHGYKTAIISGGFQFFAEKFRARLGMDYALANDLDWEGEFLSGRVKDPVINAEEKARLLEELAKKEMISLEEVIAVGDGANDLLMLAKAGMGIAYHAKEKVRLASRYQVGHGPLSVILYFLGIPGNHFE
jgi:phosphoserine phosphatase